MHIVDIYLMEVKFLIFIGINSNALLCRFVLCEVFVFDGANDASLVMFTF
jgi:hypothetical protein